MVKRGKISASVFLILVLVVIISGCGGKPLEQQSSQNPEPITPSSNIASYIYNLVNSSADHTAKVPFEDAFMVNKYHYRLMIPVPGKNNTTAAPAYSVDLWAPGGGMTPDYSEIYFKLTEPYIYYLNNSNEKYLIIQDTGRITDSYDGVAGLHIYNVKIYLPHSGLESSPDNRGKAGIDENVKLS